MLRLLLESNTKGFQFRQGAFVSLITHSVLIAASVIATREGPAAAIEAAEERVSFLIPVNRTTSPPPRQESVQFLKEGEKVGSGGLDEKIVDKAATREAPVAGSTGVDEGKPEEIAPAVDPNAMYDSVATAVDVDSAVTRFSDSMAPMYPAKLLELKVEGGAYVQFVVDTLGFADTLSFRVISSTHPEFAKSVRDALPGMRFHPAILRSKKVPQLVEQPFMFKIIAPAPKTTSQAKP